MKKILVNGVIFAFILVGLGIPVYAQLGGYKKAAVDNAEVSAAADFAVGNRAENNPEQEGLELVSIDRAETQSVGGINYRLCLTVGLDDQEQQVQVIVFKNLKQDYSLKSWEVKDCGE